MPPKKTKRKVVKRRRAPVRRKRNISTLSPTLPHVINEPPPTLDLPPELIQEATEILKQEAPMLIEALPVDASIKLTNGDMSPIESANTLPSETKSNFYDKLISYGVPAAAILGLLASTLYYRSANKKMQDELTDKGKAWVEESALNFANQKALRDRVELLDWERRVTRPQIDALKENLDLSEWERQITQAQLNDEIGKNKLQNFLSKVQKRESVTPESEVEYIDEPVSVYALPKRNNSPLRIEEYESPETSKSVSDYSRSNTGINASEDSGFELETDDDEIEEKPGFVKKLVSYFDKKGNQDAEESIDLPMPGNSKKERLKAFSGKPKRPSRYSGRGEIANNELVRRHLPLPVIPKPINKLPELQPLRPKPVFPYSTSNKIYDATANTIKYGGPLALGALGIYNRKPLGKAAKKVYSKIKELSGYYLTDEP